MTAFDKMTNGTATEQAMPARQILVEVGGGRKPVTVGRLSDWEYLERSLHRLICGWGRNFSEWEDKSAVHRHIWEQAECVRRLRERLVEFPGSVRNLEAPVSDQLERLGNAVLLAPSFEDAVDGIYSVLMGALNNSYLHYVQNAHPVHDAPTVAALHEVLTIHKGQRLWQSDYRRRHPHTTDKVFLSALESEMQACADLLRAVPVSDGTNAQPVGLRTDFQLPEVAVRPKNTLPRHDFGPFARADFVHSVETRRLFWCHGYMLEHSLPDDQMLWLYSAHFMPWEFLQDVSRHLWDESRHGDSGRSRLLDFGITVEEIGFPYPLPKGENLMRPLTPQQIYERVYSCGMIAETGHFVVKREAYDDFREGGDLESAEMMLFDIIDESAHVQYAHRWLPILAEYAGLDNSNYKERGVQDREARHREARQLEQNELAARGEAQLRGTDNADYAFYCELLARMRERHPLSNAQSCPPRSPLPM